MEVLGNLGPWNVRPTFKYFHVKWANGPQKIKQNKKITKLQHKLYILIYLLKKKKNCGE